jgi:hypothetical protein
MAPTAVEPQGRVHISVRPSERIAADPCVRDFAPVDQEAAEPTSPMKGPCPSGHVRCARWAPSGGGIGAVHDTSSAHAGPPGSVGGVLRVTLGAGHCLNSTLGVGRDLP